MSTYVSYTEMDRDTLEDHAEKLSRALYDANEYSRYLETERDGARVHVKFWQTQYEDARRELDAIYEQTRDHRRRTRRHA